MINKMIKIAISDHSLHSSKINLQLLVLVTMGFLSSIYAELKCRICKKTLCCKDCRHRHEEEEHLVMVDCDICIYGRILISKTHQLSSKLLAHLKECHWPLHCIYCKKVYTTLAELSNHNTNCPVGLVKAEKLNTKTPKRIPEIAVFESPPILQLPNTTAFTSTPMNSEYKSTLKVPENITPVDSDRMQSDPISATGSETTENTTAKSKRVTFVSTPGMENVKRKPKNHENFLKVSLKNSVRQNESNQVSTATSTSETENSEKSDIYISAVEKFTTQIEESEFSVNELKIHVSKTTRKRRSYSMNETLWESAINETIAIHNITNENEKPDANRGLNISLPSSNKSDSDLQRHFLRDTGANYNTSTKKTGVWSSMTSLFRNVVHGFGANPSIKQPQQLNESQKRQRSLADDDESVKEMEVHKLKRMKLCDIRCRPPIRFDLKIIPKVDKSIQTECNDYNMDFAM